MKNDALTAQLQALKTKRAGGSPDERWLASTRETLLMQMKNTVGSAKPAGFSLRSLIDAVRVFSPEHMGRAVAIPLAVVLLMFGASTLSAWTMNIARPALPGEALYSAKLAAERVALVLAGRSHRIERRLEVAGRRLEEMVRLAVSADLDKDDKIADVSSRFSATMAAVRKDLAALKDADADEAVRVALLVDAKADEYQQLFKTGTHASRPTFRLALLSLDQVSVDALEVLVEKQSARPDVLPDARITSNVGKRIESFAGHVAVTEGNLIANKDSAPSSLLLAAKAKEAVEEARTLLSQGDFKAAVRKVSESADLVAEAESAGATPEETSSGTSTPETSDGPASASSATSAEPHP